MRSRDVVLCGLLLAASVRATAEEPPRWVLVGPNPDALEAAGRSKLRIGRLLMAGGAGLILVGTGLTIAGAWHENDSCVHDFHDGYHHHQFCGDTALTTAGAITSLAGTGALVPGILIYSEGAKEVKQARRIRRSYFGKVWLRPDLSPTSASLQLIVEH